MKRFVSFCVLMLVLVAPATALAKKKGPVYVPPNQSAASQYTEDVPTAGGNTPSSGVRPTVTPGSGGGGSSSGSEGAASSVSPTTLHAMSAQGSGGAAAASLAQAMAPAKSRHKTHRSTRHSPAVTTRTAQQRTPALLGSKANSAAGQVFRTLAGSDAGSGIGIILPLVLIASLVLATVLGVARLRDPGAAS